MALSWGLAVSGGSLSSFCFLKNYTPSNFIYNLCKQVLKNGFWKCICSRVICPINPSSCIWLWTCCSSNCVCVRNKHKKAVCACLCVCVCVRSCKSYFLDTLKTIKWPSVERTFTLPITPLPAAPFDSGQCAKQLWKRPHAFSLIECPLRNVFPTLPIFIRSIEIPTLFCHVRLVPLQVWHDGAHLDWVRVGHPVEME